MKRTLLTIALTATLAAGVGARHLSDTDDAQSFGMNAGDCPTEDSCAIDYDGTTDSWTITAVTP